jgi:photosystem II stability/assembly factor-like uncharacterized protein
MTKLHVLLFAFPALAPLWAQPVDPDFYSGIRWRLVGPFRGGKATMVSGIPGDPAVYYMGTAGSGVWKTVDGGQVWTCVSDSVRLTGIGAVALAPSRPDTVYVGATTADTAGLYRSNDGGGQWELVALQGHGVASIVIDPHNPDLVMAAAPDTGVIRSADGGKTWISVLPDANVGGVWLVFDPDNPNNVYAGTRSANAGRGGAIRGAPPATTKSATDSQIYRSTDEGVTWKKTAPTGLPDGNFGIVSLAVAPGTKGLRVYGYIPQGIFRSDDGGEHWTRATDDPRLFGGGQFHDIIVDPRDANILFVTQTSLYRSTDAGKTWHSYTGAPSGADFNYVWIDPADDKYMILAVDQGAEISMDAGRTWTTWFNQPTGQMYNVTADRGFPFFLYSAQQDSGTIATPISGRGGQITYRDWYTTNGFETARIVPDPADSDYLYATGWYGSILRVNKTTGQTQHIFERTPKYHESGSPPMGFSPLDSQTFYLATQYLLATHDKGIHWEQASPDLTAADKEATKPPSDNPPGRGSPVPAIGALAFSPQDAKVIWAGTTNGLIQLTRDGGGHWDNVASGDLAKAGGVTALEASASDAARAFAIVGGARAGTGPGGGVSGGSAPRIYRTGDYGKTWKPVVNGLPASAAHAVREDPLNRNLVFAALETGMFVSFNGGDDWQSLQLNLPAASCRDLAIEQNDLIVATYGRALWAIDDISPLRDLAGHSPAPSQSAYLFAPADAVRMQWDTYTDTPFNRDIAAAENPPDGAIIDYYLKSQPAGDLKLEIFDSAGTLVRSYASSGETSLAYKVNVPDFWLAPPSLLPKNPGIHRFVWDLRYPDPEQLLYTYYGIHVNYFEYTLADHAIPHNTPWQEPQGPMVLPGRYQVRLTVGGQEFRQPLTVRLDPRLKVTAAELRRQLDLAQKLAASMGTTYRGYNQAAQLLGELNGRVETLEKAGSAPDALQAAKAVSEKARGLTDAAGPPAGLGPMNREFTRLLIAVDQSDTPPASELIETFEAMCQETHAAIGRWQDLRKDVEQLNTLLAKQKLAALTVPKETPAAPDCK